MKQPTQNRRGDKCITLPKTSLHCFLDATSIRVLSAPGGGFEGNHLKG